MWELARSGLRQLLAARPGQTKHDLLPALLRSGFSGLTASDVNRLLYGDRSAFTHDGSALPRWRLNSAEHVTHGTYAGPQPRAWQIEALAAWNAAGRRGIVEAVTGTGKTTVGVLAAAEAVDRGERVLVLVPGRELLDQWHEILQRELRTVRVGRLTSGHDDSFLTHSVLVATVQTAARCSVFPIGRAGLLIADEVHRYGARTYAMALDNRFEARLGLTATYAREDNGLDEHLKPYFGDVVARCSYERGLADGILAPFRVAFVETAFRPDERALYEECDQRVRALRHRLVVQHGCPPEPFGEFLAEVARLGHGGHIATRDARRYLNAFSERRQLLANCAGKYDALERLVPATRASDRGLVFGETKECATDVAEILRRHGVEAHALTSEMPSPVRRKVLTSFKNGEIRMIAAPRLLDEGIDVPEADLGIVFAASRSRRQMIQRMGRVIRPKRDGRPATFVVLFVGGTSEDPEFGAHADFVDELIGVAEDVSVFRSNTSGQELLDWYGTGSWERAQ
ncbi:DEAD/DEAH box helicase [Actinoplanes sp. LDG1-06]|uniref:DEAD/DEAH box helicase n=1 Tax=Paractinoplanes ovalisporus TaxID=2810368 RepID=A0ABS2AIF1_9ACTN|nr:DEAD/DEAH box helicase [Actinoplanes ovalisporus]MBM2619009.1 DEAD/DEAH box helicase [Actinoplanes ovalisporus]